MRMNMKVNVIFSLNTLMKRKMNFFRNMNLKVKLNFFSHNKKNFNREPRS